MNSLERSLIEKTGYDNGWERVIESNVELVRLASMRHSIETTIVSGRREGELSLTFLGKFNTEELKRGLPTTIFTEDGIRPWDFQTLGAVLRRAAELGFALPDTPIKAYKKEVADFLACDPGARGTETERLVRQRIGQNLYRIALMSYWKATCAVTGIDIPEVLRASHAKPWADCETDADRLNVYNGFLLSANIDALFDKGMISFSDEGRLLVTERLTESRMSLLGLNPQFCLRWVDDAHLPFLRWHRENVYGK